MQVADSGAAWLAPRNRITWGWPGLSIRWLIHLPGQIQGRRETELVMPQHSINQSHQLTVPIKFYLTGHQRPFVLSPLIIVALSPLPRYRLLPLDSHR